jgi:hypothetical protein
VTPTDSLFVADATFLLGTVGAAALTYTLTDTGLDLLNAPLATIQAADHVTVSDGALLAPDAATLLGELGVGVTMTYSLSDTSEALFALTAAAVSGATTVEVSVTDTATVAQAAFLVPLNPPGATTYALADTAQNLAAADPALLTGATSVTLDDAATVAQAVTIHGTVAAASFSIADLSATLATALTTGDPDLATVQAADFIGVTVPGDPDFVLTVNADQFGNLLAGTTFLTSLDGIAIDGAETANLNTLDFFGGDPFFGMTLGGAAGGSYTVNLGTSGEFSITMEGTGVQDITAANGVIETFFEGGTSLGGSIIRNMEVGDQVDVGSASTTALATREATTGAVNAAGEWAFDTVTDLFTWWDDAHAAAEQLTLVGVVDLDPAGGGHAFNVI